MASELWQILAQLEAVSPLASVSPKCHSPGDHSLVSSEVWVAESVLEYERNGPRFTTASWQGAE